MLIKQDKDKGLNLCAAIDAARRFRSAEARAFFFSSRRRHTRSLRDWSSDVCSSDLRETFAEHVRLRTKLEKEKSSLIIDEKTYAQQLDLLRFQVREITGARLQPGEEIGRASCRERG